MTLNQQRIEVLHGDITKINSDAIVNAANSSLHGGGGVDGAIHRIGGRTILEECRSIVALQGPCKTGNSVITKAGNLPARYVIHTVGPIWQGGNNGEDRLLENAYFNSLKLAIEYNIRTIAFPNISTGIYSYPKQQAAQIAMRTVKKFLTDNSGINHVYFVCYDLENFEIYNNLLSC